MSTTQAERLFARRDKLTAELAQVEAKIAAVTRTYAAENRMWGLTSDKLRQIIEREAAERAAA